MGMLRISVLALFFLGSCTTGSPPAGAATRPEGTGSGEAAAHVHLVSGGVGVKAQNGKTFRAVPGVPLLGTDELTVDPGGFMVLRLRNDYLVRLDEEVTLAVADLVLLNAPQATESFEQQLSRLLTKKEREDGERIAGWHARLTGAQTVPPQPEKKKMAVKREQAARRRAVPAPQAEAEPAAPALAEEKTIAMPPASPSSPAPSLSAPPPVRWWTRVKGKLVQHAEPMPPLAAAMLKDPKLLSCLKEALQSLPVAVAKVTLMIRLEAQVISRVALGGGLRTPACAGEDVVGKKMPGGPGQGWVILEVTLH
jgi:hypothetical protein